MALVWDFARQLDLAATPGSTVSYFDEMCQSFYIDAGNIRTQIGQLHQGQWDDLLREQEVIISDLGYATLDIEHNFNGIVFGMAQHGSDVVLVMYEYMLDVSTWLESGSFQLQPDNPIKAGSITLLNADKTRFEDDAHTLFSPGSKLKMRYSYGDSDLETLGMFFIEDSPYSPSAKSFTFSGRNRLGFSLSNQTLDELITYTGTKTEVITQLLTNAGVLLVATLIQVDTTQVSFVFEDSKNYFAALSEAITLMDWYMDDLPDGTIVIGDANFIKANAAKTGIYSFVLGFDAFSRSVSRKIDGVYTRVCVRRKGATPTKVYAPIPYYEGWYIGQNKTYYQDVPDNTSDDTINRIRDQLVEGMQYSGIIEIFDVNFRPWLQIGDVAIVTDKGITRIAGIISAITHLFGVRGFFTNITVTSGGKISDPENPSTVATKYVNHIGGANRQRRLTDYLLSGSNTLSGTNMVGDTGAGGTSGTNGTNGINGTDGVNGASAYQIWLSLGNTGTEVDFMASITAGAYILGGISLWPTGTAPAKFMFTDGQAISRVTYSEVFALIGTTYGIGDGTTTFNLPIIPDPTTGVSFAIKVL